MIQWKMNVETPMKNLEVDKILAAQGDTKISIVSIENNPFVRVRKGHETIIMTKDEYEYFYEAVEEAMYALNKRKS